MQVLTKSGLDWMTGQAAALLYSGAFVGEVKWTFLSGSTENEQGPKIVTLFLGSRQWTGHRQDTGCMGGLGQRI